jgi:hypothetical protein
MSKSLFINVPDQILKLRFICLDIVDRLQKAQHCVWNGTFKKIYGSTSNKKIENGNKSLESISGKMGKV